MTHYEIEKFIKDFDKHTHKERREFFELNVKNFTVEQINKLMEKELKLVEEAHKTFEEILKIKLLGDVENYKKTNK